MNRGPGRRCRAFIKHLSLNTLLLSHAQYQYAVHIYIYTRVLALGIHCGNSQLREEYYISASWTTVVVIHIYIYSILSLSTL